MRVLLASVMFLVAVGCDSQDKKPKVASAYAARFEAAKEIRDLSERDAAYAKLAADAAEGGEPDVVKSCLQEIRDVNRRDETAYQCALGLARAGKSDSATEIAKTIRDVNKRDQVLSKLAKGELGQ